jgi:hypothetical protein
MLKYNVDGFVFRWEYIPEFARKQLCKLIDRLGQCPCVATGTYNISITYICTYVLYSYEIEDDIYASCPG